MTIPPPVKMQVFNLTNWLMQALEDDLSIMVETTSGVQFGNVTFIDTQGPFPSIQLNRDNDPPVIVTINHIVSAQVDKGAELEKAKRKKLIPEK